MKDGIGAKVGDLKELRSVYKAKSTHTHMADLAQNRDRLWSVVKDVMNLRFP